ncbi:MAG: divergent polysaccharide deacetylase family protein [Gammaproteobacteria bacterium]|nr:divergent polysaccharide deacetylase family protein [Gammaproteobacteria bacterium]
MVARYGLLLGAILLLLGRPLAAAEETPSTPTPRPLAALIIDDLGDRLNEGLRAIALPGQVTYSILPQTPFSARFAELAHSLGKEVMLHQPMQSLSGAAMGPGGLSLHMTHNAFVRTLHANLASVPHARGVNNHMGSLLTRHPGQMAWLMDALQQRGDLFFVDSTTSSQTVALKVAIEHRLPSLRRNIFLDHEPDEAAIRRQFARFIGQAKAVGFSLAIAHPYPETLRVLELLLPTLEGQGVALHPVSQLIAQRDGQRERLWQASLSPWQQGVKSSKQ